MDPKEAAQFAEEKLGEVAHPIVSYTEQYTRVVADLQHVAEYAGPLFAALARIQETLPQMRSSAKDLQRHTSAAASISEAAGFATDSNNPDARQFGRTIGYMANACQRSVIPLEVAAQRLGNIDARDTALAEKAQATLDIVGPAAEAAQSLPDIASQAHQAAHDYTQI
jgi:hypothetical protein